MLSDKEYWEQGTKRFDENLQRFQRIIESFPEPRRTQVRAMFAGCFGDQFMTAPASTRRKYHNAFPSGLLDHSLRVVDNALRMTQAMAPYRWPQHRISFCALFHDLGKAGSPGKPYYTPQTDAFWEKRGQLWEVSKDEFMPNAEKSLYLLQLYGVTVDHEEALSIRLNDGMGSESNREYSFHEPDLSLFIHWADHFSMREEKRLDQVPVG